MAKSPIQIVLNSNDFIKIWDRNPGGSNKDFYAGNDAEFFTHKTKISTQLSSIKTKQLENEFSNISYAKIILKPQALAKSHRPTSSIFRQDIAPVIGAGDLGEIFVELQPSSIEIIDKKIMQAELETRWKVDKDGKNKPNPSPIRSEIGAIDNILPYTASDKRKFSVSEGLEWLANPRTGGAYIIELFEIPPAIKNWDKLSQEKLKLFKSFTDGLKQLGNGLVVSRIFDSPINTPMVGIRIEESQSPANIQFIPIPSSLRKQSFSNSINLNKDKHASLIKFLDNHPLVRKIILPPIISKSHSSGINSTLGLKHNLPKVIDRKSYPKIGIVDGGISTIFDEWIEHRYGLISSADKDEDHGTFIAGLLLSGNSLNGNEVCKESDGCILIDLDLLPKEGSFENYYIEPLGFFSELEQAVKFVKAKTGVRIFNFSLNVEEHVSTDGYSIPAKYLDKIAEENDIIFIISAGNTGINDFRNEWPSDTVEALKILATSRNDTIKKPAESYRNLSVSALNPPNLDNIIPYALSNYSCRGPGIRIGLKPDLAHVGGSGTKVPGLGHGLFSINTSGNIIDGCGTSYAAPNVAKTLACIDNSIEGIVSRESLIALAIHHATLPEVFENKQLKSIAKDLIGFGIPSSSDEILEGNDNSITLVFANRILPGMRMSFDFSWPSCLVNNSKCFGSARLTVVSTPPFDYNFGAEFVRVNIEGHLRQQQLDGKYKGRLSPMFLSEDNTNSLYEKSLIEHSFKWSPIKVFEKRFPRGVGPSTQWKLEIEYLARDGENIPTIGIPFTALLTISDPKGEEPVFNDMRQTLQSLGVKILDIKTAARIMQRF